MKSYKIPKKSLIIYLVLFVIILVIAAFSSGYFIGQTLGYEEGKSENDVILTKILNNFTDYKDEFKKLLDNDEARYAAFGEVIEIDDQGILIANIFGIEKRVLKTEAVDNFEGIMEGDRIFVVGEPQGETLSARFYKKLPGPALKILGK